MSRARVEAVHSGENLFGPGAGRSVRYLTLSACTIAGGRIQQHWQLDDRLHLALQLDIAPQQLARRLAPAVGLPGLQSGEIISAGGQTGPRSCDLDIPVLAAWVDALNHRRLDTLAELYHRDACVHAPGGRRLERAPAIVRFWLSLLAALPDATLQVQLSSADSAAGQAGMLWRLCGHHTGPGLTPAPSGQRLQLLGMTQIQIDAGKIRREWCLFDEIDLLAQIAAADRAADNKP